MDGGPTRVIVEYGDGRRFEASFDALSIETRRELSDLSREPGEADGEESYLLFEWKDGWKEVVAVDEAVIELLRYYTVERKEEVGRLSLETTGPYPRLLFIRRLPKDVTNILLVGRKGLRLCCPQEKVTIREGGKVEHIYYDKKRPEFSMGEEGSASSRYAAVLASLEAALRKRGISASALLSKDGAEQSELYKDLARDAGLRGAEQQRDVDRFVHMALREIGGGQRTNKKGE